MHCYTCAPASAPPPERPLEPTYFHPRRYPHHLTARSYDATYTTRPYHAELQQHHSSHYKDSYSPQTTSYQPVQTPSWMYVRSVQTQPQVEKQSERASEIPPPCKSSLKKTAERCVHFDLPSAPHESSSRIVRIAAEEREREKERVHQRDRERQRDRDRDIYTENPYRRPPIRPTPPPRSSSSRRYDKRMYNDKPYATTSYTTTYEYNAHRSRSTHRTSSPQRNSTTYREHGSPSHLPRPPFIFETPLPTLPTIYIITYGTSIFTNRSETTISALLSSQIPLRHPPIPHLYTIDARNMTPPNPTLCATYSGISHLIQDIVMQDPGARKAAREAVDTLLAFGEREGMNRKRGDGGGGVGTEVSLSVCCHAGTHRSVAIAERIAQCVKSEVRRLGSEEGVRVVCRHVHRVKGRGDPF